MRTTLAQLGADQKTRGLWEPDWLAQRLVSIVSSVFDQTCFNRLASHFNNSVFGHQTMFDDVWSPIISRLYRPLPTNLTLLLKGPSQPPPFSMLSKLSTLLGEPKSYSFSVSCVPEGMFDFLLISSLKVIAFVSTYSE